MTIGKVIINNFRSISSTEFKADKNITAFVGGNETGKSNILRAVNHFFSDEPFSQEDKHSLSDNDPEIIIKFQLTQEENQKIEEISKIDFNKRLVVSKTSEGIKINSEELENLATSAKNESDNNEENSEADTENAATKKNQGEPVSFNKQEIEKEILSLLPKAILVNVDGLIKGRDISIAKMKEEPNSPAHKTISNLLAMGDITLETLKSTSISQADKTEVLQKASAVISKKLREYWKQEDIQIEITTNNTHFTVRFLDGGNRPGKQLNPIKSYTAEEVGKLLSEGDDSTKWIWTCPEERSNGFRWFVTFYSGYIHGVESESNTVLIIDDLGIYLHASAQQELLEKLKNLGIQVIYATHSFYSVSWNFRDKIYVVKKDETGSKANSRWWSRFSSGEIESPLKDIGVASVVNFLTLSKKNLIVDGILDILVLIRLSEIFSESIEEPFQDFKFYAAQSYIETEKLGLLCNKLGNTAFLLYDSTPLEKRASRRAARKAGIEAAHIKQLANVRSWPILTIEDFLPRELFFRETERMCREILGEEWIGFERRGLVTPGILTSIKARIIRAGVSEDEYKERQVGKIIKERVVPSVIDTMSLDDFENEDQKRAIIKLLTNLKARLLAFSPE